MHSRIVLSCCALITLGASAVAQKSNIVTVPAPPTSATSGSRYAVPESGYRFLPCWFALYFPAPCLKVL